MKTAYMLLITRANYYLASSTSCNGIFVPYDAGPTPHSASSASRNGTFVPYN